MKYSSRGLVQAGLQLVAPFSIDVALDPHETLDDNLGSLEFVTVARVLPGRRVSGIAKYEDKRFFAKVFFGSRARRYWQREMDGAALLARAEVPTATLRHEGSLLDAGGFVVLYEVLPAAAPVRDDDDEGIAAAVEVLARLHDADLLQTDVHLGNFVQSTDGMFVVDADSIRSAQLLRVQFANLGMLLAQRPPSNDHQVEALWQRYASIRGDYVDRMGSAEIVREHVKKQRRERVRRYLKKTLRECTEFHAVKEFDLRIVCTRVNWLALERFCRIPETAMTEGTAIKRGNSSTVIRLQVDGERYIVKRYNIKSATHRIKRWFKKRARNAWRNGHQLHFLGIATARPIALIEKRFGWFVGTSYLVLPDRGEMGLDEVLATDPDRFETLAPAVVAILNELAAAGLEHGDLKATNFIVDGDQVALIDFDAVTVGDNHGDLARFLKNWDAMPALKSRWQELLVDQGLLSVAT